MNNKAKCILALGAFIIFTYVGYRTLPKDEIVIQSNQNIEDEKIYVHIEGCVYNPGIVEIEYGTRVYELIELAGGETDEADLSKINLASILEDEQKVFVPAKVVKEKVENNNSYQNVNYTNTTIQPVLVNINTATVEELQKLSGIGSTMAERIIEYRETEGYFINVEDIMNVEGIGEGKFDKIKNDIEV